MRGKLREAIETGEILHIRYFGGSTPGAERDISPVKILEDKVRARCMETGAVKTFSIAKMEFAVPGEPSKLAIKQSFNPPNLETIAEIADYLTDPLASLGWVVQKSNKSITLHSTFKNGKVKKTPIVSLIFEEFEYVFPQPDISSPGFDWDDFIPVIVEGDALGNAEKVKRKRPWVVRAIAKDTTTYGLSKKAMTRFMEWADELTLDK